MHTLVANRLYRNIDGVPNRHFHEFKIETRAEGTQKWIDGHGYPSGHVKVKSQGKTIVGKRCAVRL